MIDPPRRRLTPVILIAAGFLTLAIVGFLLFQSNLSKKTNSIILSFHQEQGDTLLSGSIPTLTLVPGDSLVSFTILIPHTKLLQTRYAASFLIPPSGHADVPGIHKSGKSNGDAPDTLRISVNKSYFRKAEGRYLLILNELLLEEANGKQASIFFYPFNLSE
jgi:hypothetical protein